MILTIDERVELDRRTAIAVYRLHENDNVRDTLADIYCEFLPGKDRWQGEMMADKLIAAVASMRDQCADANESMDGYISRKLEETVRGMDMEAACKSLHALIESLRALDAGTLTAYFSSSEPGKTLEDLRNAIEEREYQGPYDLAARNRLIQEAQALLSDSNLTTWVINDIKQTAGEDAPHRLLEGRVREDTLAAINAMVLYTLAVGGDISSIDYPVTMDEVVLAVCSRTYMEQAYRDYRSGIISLDRYAKLSAALSAVALVTLWALESIGTVALLCLAMDNAGAITAIVTAVLVMNALGELNELIEDSIEKVISKLSMNLYRKSLARHIRKDAENHPVIAAAETRVDVENVPTVHKFHQLSKETDLDEHHGDIEEDVDIEGDMDVEEDLELVF